MVYDWSALNLQEVSGDIPASGIPGVDPSAAPVVSTDQAQGYGPVAISCLGWRDRLASGCPKIGWFWLAGIAAVVAGLSKRRKKQ